MAVKQGKRLPVEAAEICRRVALLAGPVAAEAAAEVIEVDFLSEGAQWILRVSIDKEGGVDLDDCAQVSRGLSAALDRENMIGRAFMLEVSSPGAERPLRKEEDFHRYQGRMVSVYTGEPYEGYTQFTGILTAYGEGGLSLAYGDEMVTIPLALVTGAHLTYMGRDNTDYEGE
jgi:ribosome maturation factor RimP